MAVMTTIERKRLRHMNPVADLLRLDNRLKYLDSDGSYNGPINVAIANLSSESAMTVGAQADLSGSGIAISSTVTGAIRAFSDDNGAAIAASVRGIQSRFLVTAAQTGGTIRALQGQLKILTSMTVASGVYTASQGYVELVGTLTVASAAHFSCFDASMELGGVLTVASGGFAYGVHVETTGAGTIANNGTCAAIGIAKASGAASWPVGLNIEASVTTTGIAIGATTTAGMTIAATATGISFAGVIPTCMDVVGVGTTSSKIIHVVNAYTGQVIETGTLSSAGGAGVTLSATNQRPVSFLADDAGALLGSGNYRGVLSRVYLALTQTGQVSIRAMRGHLKLASTVALTGGINEFGAYNAVEGYIELAGTHTIGANSRVAALHGYVEVTDDVTLTTGGLLVGVFAELGQVTAKAVSGVGTAAFLADRLDSDVSTHQAPWTIGLAIPYGATRTPIKIGTWISNTASTGHVLSALTEDGAAGSESYASAAIGVYCDDGGAAITESITTPIFSRYLLTANQSNAATQTALFAQLKSAGTGTRTYTTGGIRGAYIFTQLAATTLVTSAELVTINAATTLAGALAVGAGCTHAGLDVNIAGAGAITVSGTGISAGVIIRAKSAETTRWDLGLYVPAGSITTEALRIGSFSASTAGYGHTVSNTNNRIASFYADDNAVGTAGAAFISVLRGRLLCTGSAYVGEQYGLHGTVTYKPASTVTLSSWTAGILGTFEGATAMTISGGVHAAIIGRVGFGAMQPVITGDGLAGICALNNMAAAAGSGTTAAFLATSATAVDWDYGMVIVNCVRAFDFQGACVDAHGPGTVSSALQILIHVNGAAYALAAYAVGT